MKEILQNKKQMLTSYQRKLISKINDYFGTPLNIINLDKDIRNI